MEEGLEVRGVGKRKATKGTDMMGAGEVRRATARA